MFQHYCQRRIIVAWQCPSTYCHPNCSNLKQLYSWCVGTSSIYQWLPSDQHILVHDETMRDHQFASEQEVKELVHILHASQLIPFTVGLYATSSRRATSIWKITLLHIFYCCCIHCGYYASPSHVQKLLSRNMQCTSVFSTCFSLLLTTHGSVTTGNGPDHVWPL